MNLDSLLSLAEGPVRPTACQSVPSAENADLGLTDCFGPYVWDEESDDAFFNSDGTLVYLSNGQNRSIFGICPPNASDLVKRGADPQDMVYTFSELGNQLTPPASTSPQLPAEHERWLCEGSSTSASHDFSSAVRVSLFAESLRLESDVLPVSLPGACPPETEDTSCVSKPLAFGCPLTPEWSPSPTVSCTLPNSNVLVKAERSLSPVLPSAVPRSDALIKAEPFSSPLLSNSVKTEAIKADALPISCMPSTLSTNIKRKARAARKRQQNKDAAVRYRMRKQQEQQQLHGVCEELRAENAELLCRQERLKNEIAYVRGLVVEVMKARKERAAAASTRTVDKDAKPVASS